jgi:toxin ParE1/3/4
MPTELVWSNQACADLLEIYVLIGLMGVCRPDIRPSMRMLVEAPYSILYRTDPNTDKGPIRTVEIVRVIDGRTGVGDVPGLNTSSPIMTV